MANIGDNIRSRYISNNTLMDSFDNIYFTFHAQPSVASRESLESYAFGMFPPGHGQQFNGSFIYTHGSSIATVHAAKKDEDTLLTGYADWYEMDSFSVVFIYVCVFI